MADYISSYTGAVIDTVVGNLKQTSGTAAGAGAIGTGTAPTVNVATVNNEIVTSIAIDLTGLESINDLDDVIGLAAGGVAYLTRVTTAVNGIIHRVEMTCIELPTASSNVGLDIDLLSDANGTRINDFDASGMTDIIIAGGNHAVSLTKESALGTVPAANDYLYLTTGATHTGDSTYTAGQFIIKLYGYALI